MILYPTETIYALGVNALEEVEIAELFRLKGRDEGKAVSWLVRDFEDITRWGEVNEKAAKIAEHFLPGPLTLVLCAKENVPLYRRRTANEVSFRISPDPIAQQLIADYMATYDAPLTCTSANISGLPTLPTVLTIIAQFRQHHGTDVSLDWSIYDDGPRTGAASTVVRVVGDDVTILREGAIPALEIIEIISTTGEC
jgi:L-threonylcarbamoyladenylate synthase